MSDTFEEIVKSPAFTEQGGAATATTPTGTYLERANNLSDLDSVVDAQTNLKLKDQTADLDLNSLSINGTNLFPDDDVQALGVGDDVRFGGVRVIGSANDTDLRYNHPDTTIASNLDQFQAPLKIQNRDGTIDDSFTGITFAVNTTGVISNSAIVVRSLSAGNTNIELYNEASNSNFKAITVGNGSSFALDVHDTLTGVDLEMSSTGKFGDLLTAEGGVDVTGGNKVDIHANGNNQRLLRLFHPTAPGSAGGFLRFQTDGATDNNVVTLGVEYSTTLYNVINIQRSTRNVGILKTNPSEALDVNGNILSNGNVLSNDFNNATWAGDGYRGTNAGDWVVESLRVRTKLEAYEFVAKQISSMAGKEILSIANGRVESIDTGNSTIKVQDVRDQGITSLKQNDLWIIQESDVNNDKVSGGSGAIVRSVGGSVVNDPSTDASLDGNEVELSVDTGAIGDIEENDLIVVYGNTTDAARNAIMYRNVDRSDDNLITRVQTGVTSRSALTDPDNTAVAFGDLYGNATRAYSDYSSETFGFFAGDNQSDHVTIDATNGIRFIDGADSNKVMGQFSGQIFRLGDVTESNAYVKFDNTGSSLIAEIAGIEFNDASLVTGEGDLINGYTAGSVTGLQPRSSATTKTLFAGADNEDGLNASWWVEPDGQFYSDAKRDYIYTRSEFHELEGEGSSEADNINNDNYLITAFTSSGASNPSTQRRAIFNIGYIKPYWVNKITIHYTLSYSETQDDPDNQILVEATYGGSTSDSADNTYTSTPATRSTTVIDASGVSDGYDVLNMDMAVTAGANTGSDNTVEGRIREDIVIIGEFDPSLA